MHPILVDAAQLRTLRIPGLALTPGRVIVARVADVGEGSRGELSIAGGRLAVALPPGVRTGDELKLVVKDVSANRVVLQIQGEPPSPEPLHEPREGDREAGGGGPASTATDVLQLSYQTVNLGSIGLRFELHAASALTVTIAMATDAGLTRARASADLLRTSLAASPLTDIAVTVTAARPPLDLYA
jgi:hypothetical protein